MVFESKIGTLHVIIGSCWYSCYCACVSFLPCRYVLYVCRARTVLSYRWNVYCTVLCYTWNVCVCLYVCTYKCLYARSYLIIEIPTHPYF